MKESSGSIIRVMVITNIIMAAAICALVAREFLSEPNNAYAGGGAAGGKYIAVPVMYTQNREELVVIDTSSDVMIAYSLDLKGDKIYPTSGRTIDQDFKLVSKLPDNYFVGGESNTRQYYPRAIREALEKSAAQQ